ncbi:RbAp46 [Besnoitia besnoiti]|uniref:RbAp46 n=1 Tax=Besnoitia besnoiti TaxID=94643 RepID=A0A2A9MNT0_BESBE|nr:RbAp46 [Besnoitia besnoiti]PFH38251.1 RbAp46 [Besnoitia besnoiti]
MGREAVPHTTPAAAEAPCAGGARPPSSAPASPASPRPPATFAALLAPEVATSSPTHGQSHGDGPVPGKRGVGAGGDSPASRKRHRHGDDVRENPVEAGGNREGFAPEETREKPAAGEAPPDPKPSPEEGGDDAQSADRAANGDKKVTFFNAGSLGALRQIQEERDEEDEEPQEDPALVAEEFNNWKVNTKVLYDLVMNTTLEWPSLTVQWLPGLASGMVGDSSTVRQKLLLGTHTSGDEGNSLLVVEVSLPSALIEDEASRTYVERPSDYDGFSFGRTPCKFKTVKSFAHEGEVNCARCMPQNPDIVATMGPDGFVNIYDITMASAFSAGSLLKLAAHTADGFGLAWNLSREGLLASTSNAGSICLHDITAASLAAARDAGELAPAAGSPLRTFQCTDTAVNDCCWVAGEADLLATCADDGVVSLWDSRERSSTFPAVLLKASEKDLVTCICADENQPFTLVCGDNHGNLRVLDRRRGDRPVHVIDAAHQGEVTRVAFSPVQSGLLASASRDRFVSLWDLKRVGEEQSEEDAEDGPPELLFSHGGHLAAVSDVAWNREGHDALDKVVASVGEDNRLQIWQLKHSVFFCDDEENEENDDDDVE